MLGAVDLYHYWCLVRDLQQEVAATARDLRWYGFALAARSGEHIQRRLRHQPAHRCGVVPQGPFHKRLLCGRLDQRHVIGSGTPRRGVEVSELGRPGVAGVEQGEQPGFGGWHQGRCRSAGEQFAHRSGHSHRSSSGLLWPPRPRSGRWTQPSSPRRPTTVVTASPAATLQPWRSSSATPDVLMSRHAKPPAAKSSSRARRLFWSVGCRWPDVHDGPNVAGPTERHR